jgi:ribosome biogenesis protein BMS1
MAFHGSKHLGPVTVVTSKRRRVTFFEVPNEINAMVDAAKVADLVYFSANK